MSIRRSPDAANALVAFALCVPLLSMAVSDDRARIAAERRALLDRFSLEEKACRERFVVTACLDDVLLRRRAALAPLKQRELQIDDAERKQRAVDRQAAIQAKRTAAASRQAAPPATELRVRNAAVPRAASAPRVRDAVAEQAARAAQAAQNVQAAGEHRKEVGAAQDRVARRQAEADARQKATGKTSHPLPAPAVASAPSH